MASNISPMLLQVIPGGTKYMLFNSTGRGLWKLVPDFPQTLHCDLLFSVGAFTVINHNLEYKYMLSPRNLRELLNLRVVL